MPSDPPLHVALGPDLRRPSVRLLKVIPYEHAAPTQAAVASESRFSDISFGQKLDQVVSLIREQAQETATIKEELSALRSEMSEIRQNSKLLTESVSSSNSSTPVRKFQLSCQ